ncbi:MAG: efflux RND transporter periplasmic adaptor subunit [Rhizobiaceae bacterium]|nr:efflux RND transporter periplasmic adaptor subunit [Rhizobiaceae bacterium]
MRFLRYLLSALVLAGAGYGGWWYYTRPTVVQVVAPSRGDAAEIVYAAGVVEPRTWARITPSLRERIVEECDCEGRTIAKGDVLARMDDTLAQAQLSEMHVRLKLANEEYNRIAILVEKNTMSQQALERAASEVAQLEATISGQQARLESYVIRSPVGGQVLRDDAEVGEIAELNQPLFWVGEPKPLIVVAEVNEENIPRVAAEQKALLRSDAFPGQRLDATVAQITPKGDPVSKTYRVRFSVPDDSPLLIGMSVDVNVIIRVSERALLVPSVALSGNRAFVVATGVAQRRDVTTGIRGANGIEVLSGLSESDRLISPYPEDLAEGAKVEIGPAPAT